LEALRVSSPPIPEQVAIAAVLGALDEKTEQNRQTANALEGLARATFKAWFIDFEPVKAKAAGAAGFPGMPHATFAALPDRLTDSPLGPVPEGWDTPPFDDLVSESKERVGDKDVPAYSSTNEGLLPRDERFKKDLSKSQSKNLLVRRGDLVFGLSREILNFGAMYDEVGAVSPAYKVFRQKTTLLSPRFIETMIRQRVGYYRQVVKSSSREGQSVTADHFLRLAMLVPSEPVRQAFNRLENSTRRLIDNLDKESTRLAALRDYLLPRLLSGRVRVRPSQAEVQA
jgi:type I restriction enzyme S subunit